MSPWPVVSCSVEDGVEQTDRWLVKGAGWIEHKTESVGMETRKRPVIWNHIIVSQTVNIPTEKNTHAAQTVD